MTPQLSAHDLGLWRGRRRLCQGLSFELGAGEALQIRGTNGSGKTSLLRVLTGLGRLDEGEVRWQGEPLGKSAGYRASLCYIAHSNGLKAHLSPRENYSLYQSLAADPSGVTAHEALTRFGLTAVAERPCAYLSMGQRRRAALARLMAVKAPLWLLDEPLTSLDAEGGKLVAELMEHHLASGGLAVYATHQTLPGRGALREIEMDALA